MTPPETSPEALRVVLVDDEEPARRLLREYLEEIPAVEIVAECANGLEAVKAVAETNPDLLLLDIQMPKLDGFDVLELLERDLPVVFVTAYDEFALRAFEVHAVDYLLKPFTRERLAEALSRVRKRRAEATTDADSPERVLSRDVGKARGPVDRILIRDGSHVHVLPVSAVDYIEVDHDYTTVVSSGKRHLKQETLSNLEAQLDPHRFVRIHRSFLLNVDRIAKIELYAKDSRIAILRDGTQLPVSRAGYARLRSLF